MTQYISFGVEIDSSSNVKTQFEIVNDVRRSLSQIVNDSELVVVCDDDVLSRRLEEMIRHRSGTSANRVPVSILCPETHTKSWSKSTLFAESAIGDRLIYIRDLMSIVNESLEELITRLDMSSHLQWLTVDSDNELLYKKLNEGYKREVVPSNVIGFSASRQIMNAAFRRNDNVYDVFIDLGLLRNNVRHVEIKSSHTAREVYTRVEMNRNLIKYVSPYQPSVLYWPQLFATILIVLEIPIVTLMWWFTVHEAVIVFVPIIAIVIMLLVNIGVDNVILSRQIAARIDGKRIAGHAQKKMVIV